MKNNIISELLRTAIMTVAVASLPLVGAVAQYRSEVWCPDNGDGTYTNPVINADYSDPDVCATDDGYYLTASSFNCIPGLPVLHSRDLVNRTIIGHALGSQQPREVFDRPAHGKGVLAPAIRHHDGRFYIYWGDPDRGIMMVSTATPAGPWSEPVCVVEGRGMIDPCPLWDDDGRCYLVNGWAGSRAGFNSVLTVRELSGDGTRAIGSPRIVFDGGQENHTTEGPKMYKRDGWYWIMCPAGGVAMGWQLAMRSRSPYGPYEWRRVMEQGNSDINGPHQGAWVHTPYGEDWFLHFHDKGAYGRVVYLQPVDWTSGWPMMGRNGEPVMTWRKPKSESNVVCNLRLYTADADTMRSLWDAPNLLLQKTPADRFTVTAKVRMAAKEDNQYGGVVMMGRDYSALVLRRVDDEFLLQWLVCTSADEGENETAVTIATLPPTERDTIPYSPAVYCDIYLRMSVADGICRFMYSRDGRRFREAGEPFSMREGKWIGAKIGFVAECKGRKANRGWLDADWFRVTK